MKKFFPCLDPEGKNLIMCLEEQIQEDFFLLWSDSSDPEK